MSGSSRLLVYEDELDDEFTGLADSAGLMTVAGFGSLLSERSARFTFPNLVNFRAGQIHGWRRVFAHTADVFFVRGIARPDTGEVASLSVERITPAPPSTSSPASSSSTSSPASSASSTSSSSSSCADAAPSAPLVVSLFEVPATPDSVAAFIGREHEFRFVAVQPADLEGRALGRKAVVCAANTDADYKAMRCPPQEWERRWGVHGIQAVWGRGDVLPCRAYLRHCVLAAASLGPEAEHSFLHATYLADRRTTIAQHLARDPTIMEEQPPPALAERYNG